MKKTLLTALLVFALVTVLSLPVFAEASPEGDTLPLSQAAEDVPSEAEESTPITSTLSAFFTENGDTLLGVLTLLGSLLVAFFYKMGLLPLLRSGLSALSDLMGKAERTTEDFTKSAGETFQKIESYTAPLQAMLGESQEKLNALLLHITDLENSLAEAEKEQKGTKDVLTAETELFYELLSSVNLPEIQKESMKETYYRLKKKLEEAS